MRVREEGMFYHKQDIVVDKDNKEGFLIDTK